MNKITVLFFATLRDKAGMRSITLELPEGATVQLLKTTLAEELPALAPTMDSVLVAVNHEYASGEGIIPAKAEVAIFPPVSGG